MRLRETVKFHSPDVTFIPVKSPLLSVSVVQSVLYCDSKQIMDLVDDGSLLFAFDIKTRAANKISLRILTQSLVDYVQEKKPDRHRDEEKIYQSILPAGKISIPGVVLARTLNCDADHIGRLIRDGSFKEFTRRDRRTQTAHIGRDSVLRFLKQRRLL